MFVTCKQERGAYLFCYFLLFLRSLNGVMFLLLGVNWYFVLNHYHDLVLLPFVGHFENYHFYSLECFELVLNAQF